MEANLLDKMLSRFLEQRTPVTFVLQNKVRITGTVRAFDNYVIVLENQKNDILYRHAVSSLFPADAKQPVNPPRRHVEQQRTAPQVSRPGPARHKGQRPASRPSESADTSINTSMKEGLLRWMQGNKASK